MAVGPGVTRRTNKRLARVRLNNPGALPNIKADNNYTSREARRVKKVDRRQRAKAKAKQQAKGYNPLAPLTGAREKQELNAATRLEFAPREKEIAQARANSDQNAANTATYYDDWRQALRESTARIRETNRVAAEQAQARVDQAFQQDSAGVAQRDAAASEQAAKFGRPAVQSEEGQRSVESQRVSGNAQVTGQTERNNAVASRFDLRESNAALGKAQALQRRMGERRQIDEKASDLAKEKGDFRVTQRGSMREKERNYALARKEFGLKKQDMLLKNKGTAADRKLERQKLQAQKIVARIYAGADKAGARAQIRVAKLQLEKGKISQKQYREIVNIYKGLPAKGKPGGSGKQGGSAGGGTGSGAGGSLAPWERDKISNAVSILDKQKASITDRKKWMAAMQAEGVPARLARIAWKKYVTKRQRAAGDHAGGPNGTGTL